jgi:hypothetical protein
MRIEQQPNGQNRNNVEAQKAGTVCVLEVKIVK